MIKFTRTRRDWDDLTFAKRMLRAGADGYHSLYHQVDWDDYALLSTASEEELSKNYTEEDLEIIWETLEELGEKQSKEFTLSSGLAVVLYWEIDRFSK